MARRGASIDVAGVRLTHADKVLYPEQGITKRDLAAYYVAVAEAMLPHIARRPITLLRCPAGRRTKCFYQRHAGSGVPRQLGEVAIAGFEQPYLYLSDVGGLIALVQMGVLELHPWGATIDRPDRPDRIVFDLDPGAGVAFSAVIAGARTLRARLADIGLESFVKTTGGKGLHVVLPIERRLGWPEVKAFARTFAQSLADDEPERYLTRLSKAERRGRIFIDYLRNDPTSTAVAPYSTRARPGAPVATPLAWEELGSGLDPAALTIRTVPARLAAGRKDAWADLVSCRQRLPAAVRRPNRRRAASA